MTIKDHNFKNPIWFSSGHLQTILGAYWPCSGINADSTYYQIDVEGNDQIGLWIDCHQKAEVAKNAPVVLLIHGLGGSGESPYIKRLSRILVQKKWVSARMEMRGVGVAGKTSKSLYHSGRSEDVSSTLQWLAQKFPQSPLFLVGYSLGAAVSLHYLTRQNVQANHRLCASALVSPPLDLVACTKGIQKGFNRIYDRNFSKSLWKTVNQRPVIQRQHREQLPKDPPETLWDFDDQITAPLAGFDSALDYYQRCSSFSHVDQVQVPTLVIASQDDPIIPIDHYKQANWSKNCQLCLTEGGGHLGYLSGIMNRKNRWLEKRIATYLEEQYQDNWKFRTSS